MTINKFISSFVKSIYLKWYSWIILVLIARIILAFLDASNWSFSDLGTDNFSNHFGELVHIISQFTIWFVFLFIPFRLLLLLSNFIVSGLAYLYKYIQFKNNKALKVERFSLIKPSDTDIYYFLSIFAVAALAFTEWHSADALITLVPIFLVPILLSIFNGTKEKKQFQSAPHNKTHVGRPRDRRF